MLFCRGPRWPHVRDSLLYLRVYDVQTALQLRLLAWQLALENRVWRLLTLTYTKYVVLHYPINRRALLFAGTCTAVVYLLVWSGCKYFVQPNRVHILGLIISSYGFVCES